MPGDRWTVDGAARELCGCLLCRTDIYRNVYPDPGLKSCSRIRIVAGIRAGIAQAIEVTREPDMLYSHEVRWRLCERYGFPK